MHRFRRLALAAFILDTALVAAGCAFAVDTADAPPQESAPVTRFVPVPDGGCAQMVATGPGAWRYSGHVEVCPSDTAEAAELVSVTMP